MATKLGPGCNAELKRMGTQVGQRRAKLIEKKLEEVGCDPILIMAAIAMNRDPNDMTKEAKDYVVTNDGDIVEVDGFPIKVRLEAAKDLANYIAPKLRSVEHEGEVQHLHGIQFVVPAGLDPKWMPKNITVIESQELTDGSEAIRLPTEEAARTTA